MNLKIILLVAFSILLRAQTTLAANNPTYFAAVHQFGLAETPQERRFSERQQELRFVVRQLERAGRPSLTSRSKVLYPFTLFTSNLDSFTFYEPADRITLYNDGSVSYVRFDQAGRIAATGTLRAEDMLVKLTVKFSQGFRVGQSVCLTENTMFVRSGTKLTVKDFYEKNFVTVYSMGLFSALDSKPVAVKINQLGNCRR